MQKKGAGRENHAFHIEEQSEDDRLEREDIGREHQRHKERLRESEIVREQARQPSQEQFHTFDSLMKNWGTIASRYDTLGFENAVLTGEPITTPDRRLIGVAVNARNKSTQQMHNGWITMEFGQDRTVHYRSSVGNEIIESVLSPEEFEGAWLQHDSETTKIVKSRPAFMYPDLFDLPHDEVWPTDQDAKVAVIGDPFQACDREGVTIIEYEYADEMVPPILHNRYSQQEYSQSAFQWLSNLHFEDLRALQEMFGAFTPYGSNPYLELVNQAFEACEDLANEMSFDTHDDNGKARRKEIVKNIKTLIKGEWEIDEMLDNIGYSSKEAYKKYLVDDGKHVGLDYDEQYLQEQMDDFEDTRQNARANMERWHGMKTGALEKLGDPKEWEEFIDLWKDMIAKMPIDKLQAQYPNIDSDIEQTRHWLQVLPTATSPERVANGMRFLDSVTDKLLPFYDVLQSEAGINMGVFQTTDRDFGVFGYHVPGFPISLRTKKILTEAIRHIESLEKYQDGLFPHLLAEEQRLNELGVPLTHDVSFEYFRDLEKSWVKQHLFEKRTQKAVPIHGFFPYDMPEIDPQDRILALTSVSMHGWNRMRGKEFKREIELSIPSLKIGGKYILGPINQHVYFGGDYSQFDSVGLTDSLQELKREGVIEYEFKKGVRNYEEEDRDLEVSDWNQNDQELHDHESAHSLVITRLK